jgi:hypothetical protein
MDLLGQGRPILLRSRGFPDVLFHGGLLKSCLLLARLVANARERWFVFVVLHFFFLVGTDQ